MCRGQPPIGESYMDSDTDMLPGICGSDASSLEEDDFLAWDYWDDIPSGDPFGALGHVKGPQTHGKEILWSALSQQQVNKLVPRTTSQKCTTVDISINMWKVIPNS